MARLLWLATLFQLSGAVRINVTDHGSVGNVASSIVSVLMGFYSKNATGSLPQPQYPWWLGGVLWDTMIDYQDHTGDKKYEQTIIDGLLSPRDASKNFTDWSYEHNQPWNDPVWWAFAVLNAHEKNLPQPKSTTWLDLAKNEFNELMTSWDNTTCGGGLLRLRQQNESGYDYKNSITNGGGVLLAAQLYRITRNETYAASANRLFDWLEATTLVDLQKGAVYDGIDKTSATACSAIDRTRWSYNVGQLVYAAANMASASGEAYSPERQKWQRRMRHLANGTDYFHTPTPDASRVLAETACEGERACDENAVVFKGLFARWMAKSLALHRGVADPWWRVRDVLRYSAKAAADSFKPGPDATCFGKWYGPAGAESSGSWPKTRAAGDPSAGECLVTLGVVQSLLDLSDQDFYGPEMFP